MERAALINENTIKQIEKAFEFNLYDWQVDFLLKRPAVLDIKMTGREQGKTFTYILDLLLNHSEPLNLRTFNNVALYCDWWSIEVDPTRINSSPYPKFFKRELKIIYDKLHENGIPTRIVFFGSDLECKNCEWLEKNGGPTGYNCGYVAEVFLIHKPVKLDMKCKFNIEGIKKYERPQSERISSDLPKFE